MRDVSSFYGFTVSFNKRFVSVVFQPFLEIFSLLAMLADTYYFSNLVRFFVEKTAFPSAMLRTAHLPSGGTHSFLLR